MLFCLSIIAYAGKVPLNYHPNGSTHGGNGKSPTSTWFILQEDNVLKLTLLDGIVQGREFRTDKII